MSRVYLDHAATAPMHPDVIKTMTDVMQFTFGNPSSIHAFGREARHQLDEARSVMAKSIGAKMNEIVFTSGGTEADNMAIIGTTNALKHKGNHIITTEIEHHAVLHTCEYLQKNGYDVTYLPVNEAGRINIEDLKKALRNDTILVTIMYGNNEVGSIQPISEIGDLLKDHQAIFHTDAVQAYGVESINVKELQIDLLSVSAHKINGPKGIGFLYIRDGITVQQHLYGGEQERKRRAGTENVASIAGFKQAVVIAQQELKQKREQYRTFKQILLDTLKKENVTYLQNGLLEHSLPHVINLSFPGTNVEAMLVNLDLAGVAVSSGSACTAGTIDPSHVLVAMYGKDSDRLRNSIRFSFGLYNTEEDIRTAALQTAKVVHRLTK